MSIKKIGLRDSWVLPGTSELYAQFDTSRFKGLEAVEQEHGVRLTVGPASTLVPWSNILGIEYVAAAAPALAKAK